MPGPNDRLSLDAMLEALTDLRRTANHAAYRAGCETGLEFYSQCRRLCRPLFAADPTGTQFYWQGMLHAWCVEYAEAIGGDERAPVEVFKHLLAQDNGDLVKLLDLVRQLHALGRKEKEA